MGFFGSAIQKIKQGLTKTRDALMGGLRSILAGRVLTDELLDEVEQRLLQSDIGLQGTNRLIGQMRQAYKEGKIKSGEDAIAFLKTHMANLWGSEDRSLKFAPSGTTVILVAGVNGAGKTTSIAKLAKTLRDQDRTVMLAACDTFRAAAVQQLQVWADRIGVEVIKGQQGGDPAAVAYDACQAAKARGVDVLVVDTAGRLHTQKSLMDQLTKIHRVCGKQIPGAPHEVLLVLDATTGQNAVNQAAMFKQAVDVSGIFLAKLDGTARGGVVVAIREQLGIPVKLIGVGETPDDVAVFDPQKFVEAMFEE